MAFFGWDTCSVNNNRLEERVAFSLLMPAPENIPSERAVQGEGISLPGEHRHRGRAHTGPIRIPPGDQWPKPAGPQSAEKWEMAAEMVR